jgi:hypothetical protein
MIPDTTNTLSLQLGELADAFHATMATRASSFLPPIERDNSFRVENWIMVFPFNFLSYGGKYSQTLALLNSLYVMFFLREDDILDEYHLPNEEFRLFTMRHCEAQQFRSYAIAELIELCGKEISPFILRYEQMYYNALIWEKTLRSEAVSFEAMASREHCEQLGRKVMPLCLSFAAFCLLTGNTGSIAECEELIINYHTAHQLFDDRNDERIIE